MGWLRLATQEYVDGQVDTVDTLSEILANGNRTSADGKIEFRDAAIHISSSADGQLDIVADTEIQIAATTIDINGAINASGEIIAASLDISGNVDIDGTMEADAITVNGSTLASVIAGTTVTNATNATNATNITVADSTDTTCFVGLWESVTGAQAPKSDLGLTYNAGTGMLTATGFTGPLTGTLQTASQTNITEVGTIGTGEWRASTVDASYGGTGVTSIGALKNVLDDETWTFANAVEVPALTVTGNLDVTGVTTTIDSANLAITDAVIQLSVLANQTDYAAVDSAIIFGHSTNANGGKIINDASTGFKFTELTAADDAKDGTVVGEGTAGIGTYVNAYMKGVVLDEISAPSPVINGMLYFDGTDVFIGTD